MELDHEFTVPVPVEQAWQVLLDVERIAPCMPGATLDSVDGDEFTGRLKVRLGAMTITYKGAARIASRDESARTVTIEASGKEARGSGTASATVQAQLHDEDGRTRVTVHTKLNVTGRPAQFGRGILAEVGGKLVKRFADNLAEEIARDEAEPAGQAAAQAPAETAAPGETATPAGQAPAEAAESAAPAKTAAPGGGGAADATAKAGTPAEGDGMEAETGARASTGPGPLPSAEAPSRPRERRPSAEAIDLLEVAGPSIAKRVLPAVFGLAFVWAIVRRIRRRR